MWKDPIVDEVRKVRSQIEAECNNNIEVIYQKALKIQNDKKRNLISLPFKENKFSKEREPKIHATI